MLLLLLAQAPNSDVPAHLRDTCGEALYDCPDYQAYLFSQAYTHAALAWAIDPEASVQRQIHCVQAIDDCLATALGPGRLYRQGTGALYVVAAGPGRVRQVLLEEPVSPGASGMIWSSQTPSTLEVRSDRIVPDPLELPLDGPALRSSWGESERHPDFLITGVAEDTLETRRPLEQAPYVVCPQEIRSAPLPLRSVQVRSAGFHEEGFELVYEYALPCDAELLLGGALPFIEVGPRSASSMPKPSRGTQELPECPEALEEGMTQRANSCTLSFAGDVNADDVEDYVTVHVGEMGCGWSELWTSENGGFRRVGLNTWDC